MANFDQFQPDSTQGFDGDYDNDNDFERVDADRPLAMSDNPEEDRYASEQPEAQSQQVPTADLLGSFGFGDSPDPAAPDYSSPGTEEFGGFVEDPNVPDTTATGSLGDFDHLQEIKPKEKVEEPKPVSQPPKPAPTATPTATSIAEKPTPSPRSQASPSVGSLIDLSKLDPRVVDLVYWRDLKKSGVVFGSNLFVLIALSLFSFISVLAYLLLAALTVTISFRVYKTVLAAVQKSDEGSPFKPYLEIDVTLSEDQIESYSKKAVQKINVCITSLRHLLLVEDLVDSIKFAVALWLLTYLGAWFNGLTLIILAYIGLFSMPVVYEKYQAHIDDAVGKAQEQINTALNTIKTKIPWLKKKED